MWQKEKKKACDVSLPGGREGGREGGCGVWRVAGGGGRDGGIEGDTSVTPDGRWRRGFKGDRRRERRKDV